MDLTHASFFSGVGGLDLGLERAGWRTVSFSEIDPYASAVLTERWPGIANLGDVTRIAGDGGLCQDGGDGGQPRDGHPYQSAVLWTAGFPCQDLSVGGKRRGFGIDYELDPDDDPEHAPDIERQVATRSGLAFAFLDLVADVRPPAILLENVPGLLSSHGGRDLYTLLRALGELGYGWAYRVLDARYFGVPQRRRRVFIVALDTGRGLGAERAAEVLSVGHRCARHPATGHQTGPGVAQRAGDGADVARTGTSGKRHDDDTDTLITAAIRGNPYGDHVAAESHLVSAPPDASGVRAAPRMAGRVDDRDGLANALRASDGHHGHGSPRGDGGDNLVAQTLNSGGNNGGFRTEPGAHLVAFNPYRTLERDGSVTSGYAERPVVDALHGPTGNKEPLLLGEPVSDDPLLPLGLDSHRYRCAGNGVVAPVAEYIGTRLRAALESA